MINRKLGSIRASLTLVIRAERQLKKTHMSDIIEMSQGTATGHTVDRCCYPRDSVSIHIFSKRIVHICVP